MNVMQKKEQWKEYLQPKNPVMDLFAGKNSKEIPVMPICQPTSCLPFHARRIVEKWIEVVKRSGKEAMDLKWEDYLRIRLEVYKEMGGQVNKERVAFEKSWAAREAQVKRLFLSTANIYGSMQGKVGFSSLPQIRDLELLELESGEDDKEKAENS